MNIPLRLTFHDAEYALDGGSITLHATDERGAEHHVYIPRNIYSDGGTPRHPTGLLYFDNELIPVRSDLEHRLLRLFRESRLVPASTPRPGSEKLTPPFTVVGDDLKRLVRGTPEGNLRWLVGSVISFVESDSYARSRSVGPT